jgi:hypothetical protein
MAQPGEAAFTETNELKTSGASFDDTPSDIVIHGDTYGLDEKARLLAFMEEPVTIMVHESTDPNAEAMVFVAVNGEGPGPAKTPWIPRGQPVTIKRKFVEALCRAKGESVKSIEVTNNTGERSIRYPKHSALRYPFSIVEDQNPRGSEWLRKTLAQR